MLRTLQLRSFRAEVSSSLAQLIDFFRPLTFEEIVATEKPQTVVNFDQASGEIVESPKGWRVVSDAEIGGKSNANIEVIEKNVTDKEQIPASYLRFSGNLFRPSDVNEKLSEMSKGYCAVLSAPWTPPRNFGQMESVELCVRTDGRRYAVNLGVDSFNPSDLYQCYIIAPAGTWSTIQIPVSSMVLKANGRILEHQRKLDGDIRLKSVGLLIADEEPGDFFMDLAWLRLVPFHAHEDNDVDYLEQRETSGPPIRKLRK